MKQVKKYLAPDVAKRKVSRFPFWAIKDENGVVICSASQNNPEKKSFDEILEQIIDEGIDAEIQVRYGSNEQSSRNNPPFFVKVNDEIEWVNPTQDEKVNLNGLPQKTDKNGNVNINLSTPSQEHPTSPPNWRDEMDFQLKGLRQEYELKNEQTKLEMQNKILEQTIQFKNMLLEQKENELKQREEDLDEREAEIEDRISEIQDNLKGYFKEIPSALAGLFRDFIKKDSDNETGLSGTEDEPKKKRTPVKFRIRKEEEQEEYEDEYEDEIEDDNSEIEDETEYNETEETDESLTGQDDEPEKSNKKDKKNNNSTNN